MSASISIILVFREIRLLISVSLLFALMYYRYRYLLTTGMVGEYDFE